MIRATRERLRCPSSRRQPEPEAPRCSPDGANAAQHRRPTRRGGLDRARTALARRPGDLGGHEWTGARDVSTVLWATCRGVDPPAAAPARKWLLSSRSAPRSATTKPRACPCIRFTPCPCQCPKKSEREANRRNAPVHAGCFEAAQLVVEKGKRSGAGTGTSALID